MLAGFVCGAVVAAWTKRERALDLTGISPLYGDDVRLLREELHRIRFLLEN